MLDISTCRLYAEACFIFSMKTIWKYNSFGRNWLIAKTEKVLMQDNWTKQLGILDLANLPGTKNSEAFSVGRQ